MRMQTPEKKAIAHGGFAAAAVLSAGLALLPSCAESYMQSPLTETAPSAAQGPGSGAYVKAGQSSKESCVAVPERRVTDIPGPHKGSVRYITETKAVEVGDYAIPEDLGMGVLKVVKVDNESVGLTFLESRNSVWLLQYGQESSIGEFAIRITARADLCSGSTAKLTITYPANKYPDPLKVK